MKRYCYRYGVLLIFVFALNVVFAQEVSPCRVDANTVFNLDWNPSGDTLAFGSNCGVLLLNDRLDQLTGVLPLDSARDMASVAFNHNGTLIAASVRYQEGSQPSISIIIWDAQTNSVVRILEGQFSSIPIAWHPSQDIFVFGYDEEMLFYDMQSSMVVFQFNPSYSDEIMGDYPTLACWSPRGSYVLLSFMYAPRYLITFPAWETAQGNMASYYGGACTPDATLLGGLGGGIQDLLTNTRTVPNVECEGISVAWRTNGAEEHAVNCRDQTVRVYDRAAQLLFTLEGSHRGHNFPQSARSIEYSPDGGRLVALGDDGVARLWDTSNYELITRVNVADIANLALAQQ